jgi:hypothetical protein
VEQQLHPHLKAAAEFTPAILCTREVLGQEYCVTIGGQHGWIIFPSLPEEREFSTVSTTRQLKAPAGSEEITSGQNDSSWGMLLSYPNGLASVSMALLKFPPSEGPLNQCADAIYEAYAPWLELFVKYIVLQTQQNTWKSVTLENNAANLRIFHQEDGRATFRSFSKHVVLSLNVPSESHFLTASQLKKAAMLASLGVSPKLQYRLLLEAYQARAEQDWRKVILEATGALECCLVDRITEALQRLEGCDGVLLLKNYQGLKRLVELSKILKIPIPNKDLKKKIVDPRNSVAHKAEFVSADVAMTALKECDDLIRELTPQLSEERKA